jgi:uncharacterized UBP type Zn finger protein
MKDLHSETWQNTITDVAASSTAGTTVPATTVALAPELLRLQHIIKSGTSNAISDLPRHIKHIVAKHSSKFIGNSQEDAHEFFLDLINLLHEELHGMTTSSSSLPVSHQLPHHLSTTLPVHLQVRGTDTKQNRPARLVDVMEVDGDGDDDDDDDDTMTTTTLHDDDDDVIR